MARDPAPVARDGASTTRARSIARAGSFLVLTRPLRVVVDAGAAQILETPTGATLGVADWLRCFVDEDRPPLVRALRGAWRGASGIRVDARVVDRDGFARWIECGFARVDERDGHRRVVGMLRDVHVLKETVERLRLAARQDALTGLLHFQALREALQSRLVSDAPALAVIMIDVDRFRRVVGAFGHETGERLLQAIGGRLRALLRDEDLLGRLGGDGFVAVAAGVEAPAQALALSEKLLEAVGESFDVGTARIRVSASAGIAVCPADGDDVGLLLRRADAALQRAKTEARRGARLFSPEMGLDQEDRLFLEHDLRQALARREMVVAFQPIVSFDEPRRGGQAPVLSACEVLVRWSHPVRGIIAPSHFIPLAEQIGLIGEVGRFTLERALRQFALWSGRADGLRYVSVNVAPSQFDDDRFPDDLARLLERTGLPGGCLQLEITEGTVMSDPVRAGALLQDIKRLGVRLALDDFGTGYSSLAYLGRFPIDVVKIDRSFVTPLGESSGGVPILAAIVALARAIGAELVAEGVETAAQRDTLLGLGVYAMQGDLFGRAVPGSIFERAFGGG